MRGFQRKTIHLTMLLIAAAGLRFFAAGWWQARMPAGGRFVFGDSESYWELGRAIAAGDSYEFGSSDAKVFRTPGYPLLLAGLFQVWGAEPPLLAARSLSAVLGTLAVGGVVWLAGELFDVRTALLAGWMAALYPGAIALSVVVLAEAPFCALVPVQLVCWKKGWQSETTLHAAGWLFAAGVAAGLATLMRPSWLLFTPFAIGVALVFQAQRKRHAWAAIWLMTALAMTMSPWWLRNYRVTGHLVPTTLQVGASLYDGLNPRATGASNMDFVESAVEKLRADDERRDAPPADPFEYRLDRLLLSEAIQWARSHPVEVVKLAGIKVVRMWNLWPNEPQFRRPIIATGLLLTYAPLFVLALIGAWRYARRGWPYLLCLLPAVYLTLLHMIFVSSIRYREPAMLILIVLAAAAVVNHRSPSHAAVEPS